MSNRRWIGRAIAVVCGLVLFGGSTGVAGAARGGTIEFYAPAHVSCEIDDSGTLVGVFCQRLAFGAGAISRSARITAGGDVVGCSVRGFSDPSGRCGFGNPGEHAPTYKAGRRVTLGRFRCRMLSNGVQCAVIATGRGFRLTPSRVSALGGARLIAAPFHYSSFRSPDRQVWCTIGEGPAPSAFCGAGFDAGRSVPQRSARMGAGGRASLCAVAAPSVSQVCFQNWDTLAPILAYGRQVELDGFLCTSARDGITCVVEAGRRADYGFRVSAASTAKVTPAPA